MTEHTDPAIAALAVVVMSVASYFALDMAGRVRDAANRAFDAWLLGAGAIGGLGIWAMHWISVLATGHAHAGGYAGFGVLAAALAPMVLMANAIYLGNLRTRRQVTRLLRLAVAGAAVLLAAGSTHWLGRHADVSRAVGGLDVAALLAPALGLVVVAAAALFVTRWAFAKGGWLGGAARCTAAVIMGLSLSGFHAAMDGALLLQPAAASTMPGGALGAAGFVISAQALAVALVCVLALVALLGIVLSLVDGANSDRVGRLAESLRERNALLKAEIRERESLAERLQASNAELERFAYVASHDLQAPLRTVSGFAALLRRRAASRLDAGDLELLSDIQAGTASMRDLIDALLELSKVRQDKARREWFALRDAAADAMRRLHGVAEERGARISIDLPEIEILGDAVLMTQLLQNLLSNALKFQPGEAPQAWLNAERTADGGLHVSVRDAGIGITEDQQPAVFDIFRRLHTAEEFEGTGIGLALVRKIAGVFGGGMLLKSVPKEGSTFTLALPPARVR